MGGWSGGGSGVTTKLGTGVLDGMGRHDSIIATTTTTTTTTTMKSVPRRRRVLLLILERRW